MSDKDFETFEGWSESLQSEEQERILFGSSEEEETVPLDPSEERETPPTETPTIQIEGDIYQRLAQSLSLEVIQNIGPIHQDIEEDIENLQNSVDEAKEDIIQEIDGLDDEIIDSITTYLDDEVVPYLQRLQNNQQTIEQNQYELGQIVIDVHRTLEQGFESIELPDNIATTDDIPSDYTTQEDLDDLYDRIEQLVEGSQTTPEPDTPETDYLARSILEMAEEYERSTDRLETLRENHRDNMSDESVSDILYD